MRGKRRLEPHSSLSGGHNEAESILMLTWIY